jgi:hypothetical protein
LSVTVIFICAHSEDGAMGFILNRPQHMRFEELVETLNLDGDRKDCSIPALRRPFGERLRFPHSARRAAGFGPRLRAPFRRLHEPVDDAGE